MYLYQPNLYEPICTYIVYLCTLKSHEIKKVPTKDTIYNIIFITYIMLIFDTSSQMAFHAKFNLLHLFILKCTNVEKS